MGGWQVELPLEALATLRKVEPYPTYAALMGYTFDTGDPLTTAPAKARTFHNPFRDMTHFDNGVPIAPIIARLYLSVPSAASARWAPVSGTASDGSFFAWANARADHDPTTNQSLPLITNLAAFIYHINPAMRHHFPDLFGADRHAYTRWFVVHAQTMYALDRAFIAPILDSLRDWLNAPVKADPRYDHATLVLTNIALYLYHLRGDLQTAFPDVFGQHRLPFARWFMEYGRIEFSLDDTLLPLTTKSFLPGHALGDRLGSARYEWMETLRLMEATFAVEREATQHYLIALQQDRDAVREYLRDVEQDRKNVREYLRAVEQDRDSLRTYQDRLQREREQASLFAMAREQALTEAYAAIEERELILRERETEFERLQRDVETQQARLDRARRWLPRRLVPRLCGLATLKMRRGVHCPLNTDR